MKENLQTLIRTLRNECGSLETERRELSQQLVTINATRRSTAHKCLSELFPDLEMGTVKRLRKEVPGFPIPIVPKWFGFSMKVDPSVSIDTLRIQLGAYIDNNLFDPFFPKIWKDAVIPLDSSIRSLHDLIRTNSERLSDVNERIRAVEKLLRSDMTGMDPGIRMKVEKAVKMHARRVNFTGRPHRFGRSRIPAEPAYPTASQIDSDSGPDLLGTWLWHQLLTPDSEVSNEIVHMESGGRFGGAGASGSFSSDDTRTPVFGVGPRSDSSDIAAASGVSGIDVHHSLGARNFS